MATIQAQYVSKKRKLVDRGGWDQSMKLEEIHQGLLEGWEEVEDESELLIQDDDLQRVVGHEGF